MIDARVNELKTLLPQGLTRDWVRLGARLVRLLRDQRHAARHEEILDRLLHEARQSVELRTLRRLHVPVTSYPDALPISARKDEIVAAIRSHPVVVIAGETGSGKTTQIPKMCLEAGLGVEAMIGCTQPRRVAALSISRRIADELNVPWGRQVGCKIRFDDRSGPETYVKVMTDGMLLAETQGDPLLADYNALIIDEAHERSLNIDFLLGYLKGLLTQRSDLKLIITSATIDTTAFSRAFNDAPVIEVSGRTFPVEVQYEPLDPDCEERGDETFVDAAARTAVRVVRESSYGDVLIFLPGERDIREAADLIQGRMGREAEVIPLFGRLSAGDQQRVFAPSDVRKIVIATNIAETSLTIPGIRYVIDAGLARISRYNPRTRTRRLPIEPISQSSAQQRQGRAGRVESGVCIRLYSEEDLQERPAYTQPEIQRANLAEVILRMKAFRLGEIETFPFLNPPSPAAISGGYGLLRELGALDAERNLTELGRDLARLPIDPTLGRMVLQARQENAVREVLIIAAGLSIQDPRERPLDQQTAADAAHRRHAHPRSDFLSLLNLWNAAHEQWEQLRTQGQRRKFCRANFLSYVRMREWQDLEAQLETALDDLGLLPKERSDRPADGGAASVPAPAGPGDPFYDAIHRAVLSGLLGHVAVHQERNLYKTAGQREVMLFPGSALFIRSEAPKKGKDRSGEKPPTEKAKPARWIVAGEIVETSQLFARTAAEINPEWIADLAPHLVKTAHQNPRWVASAGQVVIDEIVTWQGLEIRRRRVAFGNLDPEAATALFIRTALVEEQLVPGFAPAEEDDRPGEPSSPRAIEKSRALPPDLQFLEHNRALREKIETWQTRVRRRGGLNADEALFRFYSARLAGLSSLAELRQWLAAPNRRDELFATEAELTGGQSLSLDHRAFPETVEWDGQSLAVRYAYAPGEDYDGATIIAPLACVASLPASAAAWAIPGLRAELVEEWLRTLPKSARRELQPIPPKIPRIVDSLQPLGPTLGHDLARVVRAEFGVTIAPDAVSAAALPQHLLPRIEVVDGEGRIIAAGRDLERLKSSLPKSTPARPSESAGWKQTAAQWERFGLADWTLGDLPERVEVPGAGKAPVTAWLGLEREQDLVNLRLFPSREAARSATTEGWALLVERALRKELAWLQKDLRSLASLAPLFAPLGTADELQAGAFQLALRHVIPLQPPPSLTQAAYRSAVQFGQTRLVGLAVRVRQILGEVLELRRQIACRLGVESEPSSPGTRAKVPGKDLSQLAQLLAAAQQQTSSSPAPSGSLAAELSALLPPKFLESIPLDRLAHLPRYLKALLLRIERARQNPPKDAERARQVAPFASAWQQLSAQRPHSAERAQLLSDFRWLIEEFKVSVFAQELGTAVPISAKRLTEQLEKLQNA